jgi:predicted ABC-type sugar transport system permease subunit
MSTIAEPPVVPPSAQPTETLGAYARRWWIDVKSGELGSLPIIVGLIIIAIVFQVQNDRFLTAGNFVNLMVQSAAFALIAMGIVFVLLLGEIDLSVSPAWRSRSCSCPTATSCRPRWRSRWRSAPDWASGRCTA